MKFKNYKLFRSRLKYFLNKEHIHRHRKDSCASIPLFFSSRKTKIWNLQFSGAVSKRKYLFRYIISWSLIALHNALLL